MEMVSRVGKVVGAASDADVAAHCAAGDRLAQRQLFDQEVDRVHATLYRILGPNADLEDLVQEAFLEIFRSLRTFRGEAKLSTWIGRVTAHVAYGYMESKRPAAVWLESVHEPAATDPSAERSALARQAVSRMYAILAELDPKVRLAFTLQVLEERPLEEVAQTMRSSLVATKSRVWRARRRLRRDPTVEALLGGELDREPES
jgi:RNA polymerase sigma-70 factor, ECF subfamily